MCNSDINIFSIQNQNIIDILKNSTNSFLCFFLILLKLKFIRHCLTFPHLGIKAKNVYDSHILYLLLLSA